VFGASLTLPESPMLIVAFVSAGVAIVLAEKTDRPLAAVSPFTKTPFKFFPVIESSPAALSDAAKVTIE
jgi:hypothetical protein